MGPPFDSVQLPSKWLSYGLWPDGVKSFRQWGRTIVVLPKYKQSRLTFNELLELGRSNREAQRYLRWLHASYATKEALQAEVNQGVLRLTHPVMNQATDLALFCEASNYAEEIEELGGGSGGYRREFKEWGAKLEVWRDLWKGQEALVMMSKKMWNVQSTWLKWECQLQSCILSTSRGLDIVHTFKKHDIMICLDHFWRCFLKCSVSCLLQDDYIYIYIYVYIHTCIYIYIYTYMIYLM